MCHHEVSRRGVLLSALAASFAVGNGSAQAVPLPEPFDSDPPTLAAVPPATELPGPSMPVTTAQATDGSWRIAGTFRGVDVPTAVASAQSASNGRIPASALVSLLGVQLRADAAAMLAQLSAAFKAQYGRDIRCAQGYRDYAGQVAMKAMWASRGMPNNAAAPGTSNHGLGLAVDVAGPESQAGTEQHDWLVANAPRFGWLWPCNMRPGGIGPHESWHFEFQGPGLAYLGGGCHAGQVTQVD